MTNQILVPSLGESVTEATVSKWLKQVGDKVDSDEPLVELETDKVNIEVPSPQEGTLSSIKVKEGTTVEVGSLLGIVNEGKSDSTKLNPLQKQAMEKLSLSEVAPHYFGTLVMSSSGLGNSELQNTVIIPKDEKAPCSVTESYYTISDNQTGVRCRVTQSRTEETDPQFVEVIWDGDLTVPGGRPAGQEIKVTYSYTEDGRMKASFLDVKSGNIKDIDLKIKADTSNDESIDIDQFKVE